MEERQRRKIEHMVETDHSKRRDGDVGDDLFRKCSVDSTALTREGGVCKDVAVCALWLG